MLFISWSRPVHHLSAVYLLAHAHCALCTVHGALCTHVPPHQFHEQSARNTHRMYPKVLRRQSPDRLGVQTPRVTNASLAIYPPSHCWIRRRDLSATLIHTHTLPSLLNIFRNQIHQDEMMS